MTGGVVEEDEANISIARVIVRVRGPVVAPRGRNGSGRTPRKEGMGNLLGDGHRAGGRLCVVLRVA